MNPKFLIINCDDFGQSSPMNQAIMHLLEERKVSSATIMAPAPGFEEAAEWCKRRGQSNIGLHLTLTSEFKVLRWKSLTDHASLHDDRGYMHPTVEAFERNADTRAVLQELEAQYEKVIRYGFPITHADNHMGSLYGMATGRSHIPHVLRKCVKWGLPFRLFRKVHPADPLLSSIPGVERTVAKASALAGALGVTIPDYLLSHPFAVEEGETYESFKKMMIAKMYNLPDGIVETYIHPGVADPFTQSHIPHWEKRVWEYRLMLDDDFAYALKDAGVVLTDYRYLQEHGRVSRIRSAWALAWELLRK
ncbi:polysaccharide deacetylase family protein [Paenibacillus sedimenti]|uniref:Polysaccharide deacetylase family protein n=1 Tax=Paenibacillus sedimenti TaxID=2770274 RepID=A0A926KQG8_9BACL|nr:polysaccharide deacetylase family protein [Paenibacillus sedimenti]MBD0382187.1 polysaccharide deacetylase family protein [Paenibacillus sedimenti]